MTIEQVSLNDIREYCKKSNFFVIKIDTKFSVTQMQKDVNYCIDQYGYAEPKSFDGSSEYAGYQILGLQYQKDDDNLYHNCRDVIRHINDDHKCLVETQPPSDWSEWNDIGEQLKYLKAPLESIGLKLYRTRLLSCASGKKLPRHLDYDYRWHVPIFSNTDCYMTFQKYTDDEPVNIRLPADGSSYIVNTGYLHYAENLSSVNRIHYCGIMDLSCIGDGRSDECFKEKIRLA